jgi:hypothetical protein
MKKWFLIEEVRHSGILSLINTYPLFCTEEDLPKKIKEKTEDFFGSLFGRTIYELTPSGEQKKLEKNPLLKN